MYAMYAVDQVDKMKLKNINSLSRTTNSDFIFHPRDRFRRVEICPKE